VVVVYRVFIQGAYTVRGMRGCMAQGYKGWWMALRGGRWVLWWPGLTLSAASHVPAFTPVSAEVQRAGDRSGMSLAAVVAPVGNYPQAIPYTFCLPLLSGVVGINAPIRCEFYLSTNDDAVYYRVSGAAFYWRIGSSIYPNKPIFQVFGGAI